MKNQKMYESSDSLISIISDNYGVLQSLGCFGISLGFGDKSVKEVCESQHVDTLTFLTVINFTINGYLNNEDIDKVSISTLLHYLEASHAYYLDFELPFIRTGLSEALNDGDSVARLIMKLYDEYAHAIRSHMLYEERTVFPYPTLQIYLM